MPIEIRAFEGEPAELAEFCVRCWRQAYEGSNMPFAEWSGPFMEWEVFGRDREDRHFLVAAYDGTRLVGALPARPTPIEIQGEPAAATISSYFSVDREYRDHGVALKLNLEQRRRHRQREVPFFLGYIYTGASDAKGKEYWLRQPRNVKVTGKVGLWARILDHQVVSRFERGGLDRWGAKLLGVVQKAPKPVADAKGIRPFQSSDLPDCSRLAEKLTTGNDLGFLWPDDLLARQLEHDDVPHTLVCEEQGRVTGLLNYFHLRFRHIDARGDHHIKAAVIDLLSVEEASASIVKPLLKVGLHQMHEQGCHVALILRTPCFPAATLMRHGFVAQPAAYAFSITEMTKRKAPEGIKRLHVTWR